MRSTESIDSKSTTRPGRRPLAQWFILLNKDFFINLLEVNAQFEVDPLAVSRRIPHLVDVEHAVP